MTFGLIHNADVSGAFVCPARTDECFFISAIITQFDATGSIDLVAVSICLGTDLWSLLLFVMFNVSDLVQTEAHDLRAAASSSQHVDLQANRKRSSMRSINAWKLKAKQKIVQWPSTY